MGGIFLACCLFVLLFLLVIFVPKFQTTFSREKPNKTNPLQPKKSIYDYFGDPENQEQFFFYSSIATFYVGIGILSYGLSKIYNVEIITYVNILVFVMTVVLSLLFFFVRGKWSPCVSFLFRAHVSISQTLYLVVGGGLYLLERIPLSFLLVFNPALLLVSVLCIYLFDSRTTRWYRVYNYIVMFFSFIGGAYMFSVIYFYSYRLYVFVLIVSLIGWFYGILLPRILKLSVCISTRKMFGRICRNISFFLHVLSTIGSVYLLYTLQKLSPSMSLVPLAISFFYFCWVHATRKRVFPLVLLLSILLIVYSYYLIYSVTVGFMGFLLLSIFPALSFLWASKWMPGVTRSSLVVFSVMGIGYMIYVSLVGILRVAPLLGTFRLGIIHVGILFVVQSVVWYLAWLRISLYHKHHDTDS